MAAVAVIEQKARASAASGFQQTARGPVQRSNDGKIHQRHGADDRIKRAFAQRGEPGLVSGVHHEVLDWLAGVFADAGFCEELLAEIDSGDPRAKRRESSGHHAAAARDIEDTLL